MTEISPEHIEWATVDRMRQMLAQPRQGFEVTGTLALFTGILCWTMQRIRTDDDQTDGIAKKMATLSKSLQKRPFSQFLKTEPKEVFTTSLDGSGVSSVALNSMTDFKKDGKTLSAYNGLVALRNAVGHGDARRLTPINREGQLLGYRFLCTQAYQAENNGTWIEKWRGTLSLDVEGMTSIAGELALQFCETLQDGRPNFETEARKVLEAPPR
ncbi:hypothetical protein [Paragemmobacter straminiformis]|uniref:Uncharacterized protein n=1 Tax=Paragemmobacter straminiformis TaxID=2045119 RepID=A0A842I2P7_9RHOB|nr:hypothetical protein [Gemmobacter straminiformis]MBC2834492.1 hypothetical protein [Gemmobacter straminiformis]